MHQLIALALGLTVLLAACSSAPVAPTPAPSVSGAHAGDLQAPYLLTLELPTATWKADQPITGVATLALVQGNGVDLGAAAGGPFGFEFASLDGIHKIEPVSDAVCAPYRLEAGKPLTSPIRKSGGFYPEQPDFEFNRAFLTRPDIRLPAGDWNITAVASFIEGQGCSGLSRTIRTTIQVHVTP
jgi:hypothetical protein